MIDYIHFKELTNDVVDVITLNKLNQKLLDIMDIDDETLSMAEMFLGKEKLDELRKFSVGELAKLIIEMDEDAYDKIQLYLAFIKEGIKAHKNPNVVKDAIDKFDELSDVEKDILHDYFKAFLD